LDFLDVFNAVVRVAVSRRGDAPDATSYDDTPEKLGVDSLDMVMVIAVLTDAYGIPNDVQFDDTGEFTVATLRDYISSHKTQEPESLEKLLEFA
jgi:acyl carrier protein